MPCISGKAKLEDVAYELEYASRPEARANFPA
jgi:hypothetical protein